LALAVLVHADIALLSLHDALPISDVPARRDSGLTRHQPSSRGCLAAGEARILSHLALRQPRRAFSTPPFHRRERRSARHAPANGDRKSTRLNSSHEWSSYAVFCLK